MGRPGLPLERAAAGPLAGRGLWTFWAHQLRMALAGLSDGARSRWTSRVAYASVVLAGGLFFYRASARFWSGGIDPAVPTVALVAAAALALWCRRDYDAAGPALAAVAGAACAAGVVVSFHGTLPLTSLAVFGLLTLIGARLLFEKRWPLWLAFLVVALAALYQGYHAGQVLRRDTTLPVAHAASMGVLLAAVFFVCYRALPADATAERPSLRVPGLLAMALAALWQLAEHREWAGGPVASDLAMGMARLPVLAILLLVGAWRRAPAGGPRWRCATSE